MLSRITIMLHYAHVIHQAKSNSSVSVQDYVEIEVMFEVNYAS